MNDLEVLVNEKINKYKQVTYFSPEQKEKVINKLQQFLDENKFTFDNDLDEIQRLNEDIQSFTKYKRMLENKYTKYIDLDELYKMKLKRDDKIAFDIFDTFNKLQACFFSIKMTDKLYKEYEKLMIDLYNLKERYQDRKKNSQEVKKELILINKRISKLEEKQQKKY